MERENKVWEGRGSLCKDLAIYETSTGYVVIEDAVIAITDEDYEYHFELTMYAEEG